MYLRDRVIGGGIQKLGYCRIMVEIIQGQGIAHKFSKAWVYVGGIPGNGYCRLMVEVF